MYIQWTRKGGDNVHSVLILPGSSAAPAGGGKLRAQRFRGLRFWTAGITTCAPSMAIEYQLRISNRCVSKVSGPKSRHKPGFSPSLFPEF